MPSLAVVVAVVVVPIFVEAAAVSELGILEGVGVAAETATLIRYAAMAETLSSTLVGSKALGSFLTNLLFSLLSFRIGKRLLSFLRLSFLPFLEGLDCVFLVLGTIAVVAFFFLTLLPFFLLLVFQS